MGPAAPERPLCLTEYLVQLNLPFACEVCSGYISTELFDLESDLFSSSQEKRQNIWYVVRYLIYYKIFVLKAFYDLKFEDSSTGY